MNSEKLSTLAEKLEFSNALRKQHDRDRAKAEVALGKMTAYAHELEHKVEKLEKLYDDVKKLPDDQKLKLDKDKLVLALRKQITKQQHAIGRYRRDFNKLVNLLHTNQKVKKLPEPYPEK